MRLRRPASIAAIAIASLATVAGVLVVAPQTASAAGPWFVKVGGSTASTCGLTEATACDTVSRVIAKPAFVNGDTINVGAGNYTDRPNFLTKGAVVKPTVAGSAVSFDGSGATAAVIGTLSAGITVNLQDVTLKNGVAGVGGGLTAGGTGTWKLDNVTIDGNKAQAGGGIYIGPGSTVVMTGGSITGNSATGSTTALLNNGGGVYVTGKQGAVAAGSFQANNVSFSANTAVGGAAAAGGNGGAIFNAGTTSLTNVNINKSQAVPGSNANLRKGFGGAIANAVQDGDDAPVLTINGGAITNGLPFPTANASYGGAIANVENAFNGAQAVVNATNLTISGNLAVDGGAFYNAATATFTGGTQQSNLAVNGGAGYLGPLTAAAFKATTTIDGTAFTTNSALGGSGVNTGNGGALFNTGALTVKGGATFTGNQGTASTNAAPKITGWGGSIFSVPLWGTDTPSLTVNGATFKGGAATGGNAVVGGAIATAGNLFGLGGTPSPLNVTNGSFQTNVAGAAGAVYAGGPTTITGSTFTTNQATNGGAGYGGGLLLQGLTADALPTATIDSTTLTGNAAALGGGGIAAWPGTTLTIRNGSKVDGNGATSGAGVISSGATTISDSSVSSNAAGFQGGGIWSGALSASATPSLTLTNTKVDGNTAANVGGGIVSVAPGTLDVTGGEVNGNSAYGGGGVWVHDNAVATFDGTDLNGNTATSSGGGAIANAGTLTLRRATLDGNHATHTTGTTGVGAGIYSGTTNDDVATKLIVDSSTISNNEGFAGSAIAMASNGSGSTNVSSISNSTIHGNTNSSSIGAIESFHPLSITSSTITANTAVGGAGALSMAAPASVSVSGSILAANGTSCSGHPVDGGYNLTNGDTSCGFANHVVTGNPALGPLQDNGGPTATRLPGITSAAIDQIPAATATGTNDAVTGSAITLCAAGAKDQRGFDRSQGGAKCDIGSVEVVQAAPTAITGPNPVELSVGVGVGTPGPTFTTTAGYSPQVTMTVVGTLPTGVSFVDNGNGTLSLTGTPAAGTGGSYNVTIKATNEAGSATFDTVIRVHQAPILQGPVSDTYTVGQAGGPDTFSMKSGFPTATLSTSSPLPSGVTFVDNGDGTATIQGTPAVGTGGVYTIVITGSNGTQPDATFTFTLTVQEGPTIAGFAPSTATVGTAYTSPQITTTGTPAPTVTAEGLPAGLSIQQTPGSTTAKIVGTPANGTGGEYDVTLKAHNVIGDAQTTVHLTVREAPELTGPSTARIVAGFAGTVAYSADGYPVASISATGTLPAGLSFQDNGNGTATISGTPSVSSVGTYDITITASNGVSPNAVVHLSLEIAPPLAISTTTLPNASIGSPYGGAVTAIGGQPPYTFTLESGSLPAGLTLQPNGQITGSPTGATGTSTFTVRVTDAADPTQTATKQLSITVDRGVTNLAVDPILLDVRSGLLGTKITVGVVHATLTGGNPGVPIAGQTIIFTVNGTPVCSGTTDAHGEVLCTMSVTNTLIATLAGKVSASYAGNARWLPSSGSNGLIAT